MDMLRGKLIVSPFKGGNFVIASQRKSEFLNPTPALSSHIQTIPLRQVLCAYKRTFTESPLNKQALLRFSNHSAQCSFLSFQKKHSAVSQSCIFSREESNEQCYIRNQHDWNKCSRYVAVRSVIAESGVSDSAYPMSEFKFGSKVRGICFYALTAITAIFLFVLMLAAHPFVIFFDRYRRKAHHFIAKIWATLTVAPFFNIQFEGLENLPPTDTSAVYVSNHQSFLDIYTLLTLGRRFKFISKTSIFVFPVIGWAMFMLGTIPLKRMDSKSQLDCLKRCMDLIKKGSSVFFFPEGTRSKDGKLGAFKKGAFSVAAKTGVPIVPVTLLGTGKIMPAGKESILNQGSVKVVIHKPIQGSDPAALCNDARNIILEALNRE